MYLQSAFTSVAATLQSRHKTAVCNLRSSSLFHFVQTRMEKFLYVFVTYFGNEMSLFCNITRSFSYRRNDVPFILQLIWGNAIFVKVVAVSFNLSFVAQIVLTKLKTTA